MAQQVRIREILRVLTGHGVEFIIVGGISAVLQGAPINTFDLDIVHSRSEENLPRLMAALEELDAIYRFQPERLLRPSVSHVRSTGHQLLLTKYGPLDVLGHIGVNRSFEDLIGFTNSFQIDADVKVNVLNLETQIAVKEELAGAKDVAALPLLRRALEERKRLGKLS